MQFIVFLFLKKFNKNYENNTLCYIYIYINVNL